MNKNSDLFNRLQKQIEAAEKSGLPINKLVRQQIDILKSSHDEFIKSAKENGYDMNNLHIGQIEVQQYAAMKQLAKKIGLPVEEYDKLIKDVQVRILGEENYKRFFNQKNGK